MIKISGGNYYEALPPFDFNVGDIWEGLPSFGHLGKSSVKGIVVTPACDLVNRKAETLTYLPVMCLSDYLVGRGFSVEVLRFLKGQVKSIGLDCGIFDGLRGVSLPVVESMRFLAEMVGVELNSCKEARRKDVYQRILAAINHLVSLRKGCGDRTVQGVRKILGEKEFSRITGEIVKNSYSSDLHFLPSDGREAAMSVVGEHSVALFRYAMSVPVELLEVAQEPAFRDWAPALRNLLEEFPVVKHATVRPVRIGRLKSAFVPDLISRFTSLHVRMGSPDFSPETISEYCAQIGEL